MTTGEGLEVLQGDTHTLQVGLFSDGEPGFAAEIRSALSAAWVNLVGTKDLARLERFDLCILTGNGCRLRKRLIDLGTSAARTLVVASMSDAVEAAPDMIAGDVLVWPGKPKELEYRLQRLARVNLIQREVFAEIAEPNLIGRSANFRQCCALLRAFAPSHLPVLLEGETGTGKELAARALHYLSDRRDAPFVPVNCGALSDTLFENELFGHRAGAYTDAKSSAEGLVAQAEGGTLFLDEIEALSPHGQVSLLRFLENHEYRSVGGGEVRHANVRIIAASNAPLLREAESGRFRHDLYYRLAVCQIMMPALRDRPGDARLLATVFARRINDRQSQRTYRLSEEKLAWIDRQPWPGNVRELENFVERDALMGRTRPLPSEWQKAAASSQRAATAAVEPFSLSKRQAIEAFETAYIERVMYQAEGNVSLAARIAGKERRTFGRLLKKHDFDTSRFRSRRI